MAFPDHALWNLVDDKLISTAKLGENHFQTMVFKFDKTKFQIGVNDGKAAIDPTAIDFSAEFPQYYRSYSTSSKAAIGHQKVIKLVEEDTKREHSERQR